MPTLDKVFALLSLAGLISFCYVLMEFVHEPDMWVVLILVMLVASFFIIRELRMGGSHFQGENKDSDG